MTKLKELTMARKHSPSAFCFLSRQKGNTRVKKDCPRVLRKWQVLGGGVHLSWGALIGWPSLASQQLTGGNIAIERSPGRIRAVVSWLFCVVGSPWLFPVSFRGAWRASSPPVEKLDMGKFCPWSAALKNVRGAPVDATPMFGFRPSLPSVCNVQDFTKSYAPPGLLLSCFPSSRRPALRLVS